MVREHLSTAIKANFNSILGSGGEESIMGQEIVNGRMDHHILASM